MSNTNWGYWLHDLKHSGRSAYQGPQTNSLQWTNTLSQAAGNTPVVGNDGTIYLPSTKLYAYHPDGSTKWEYNPASGGFCSSPQLSPDGSVIYVGNTNGYFYAVNTSDGSFSYRVSVGTGNVLSIAVAEDGTIYVCQPGDTNAKNMYAFHSDGSPFWTYGLNSPCKKPVAINTDGKLYLATLQGIYSLNANGTLNWYRSISGGTSENTGVAISADGTTVYFSDGNGYAWGLTTGNVQVFKTQIGFEIIYTTPTLTSTGDLIFGCNAAIVSVSSAGAVNWTYFEPSFMPIVAQISIGSDDTIYFCTIITSIKAKHSDGTDYWSHDIPGAFFFYGLIIANNGSLLIPDVDTGLYCFNDTPFASTTTTTTTTTTTSTTSTTTTTTTSTTTSTTTTTTTTTSTTTTTTTTSTTYTTTTTTTNTTTTQTIQILDNNFYEFYAEIGVIYNIINMNYMSVHVLYNATYSVKLQVSNDSVNFVDKQTINGDNLVGGLSYSQIRFVLVSGSPIIKVCCNRRFPV